ncbi:universal stress protein [Pseudonocardia benzenivorans]|jgi:nucleotide-binding universal stress UspA family protein|uniref:Universal stress protein n=1 Tax=Pseudonocardia benzenivorans TaxID=228005 RepID=A0ABW3VIK3_9PSEU|nr:universal stress protein [Pseudonocardia sp. D17]
MSQQHASDRGTDVVVGVDGTSTALHAVAWAAEEAAAHDGSLTIVHAAPYAVDEHGIRRANGILGRAKSVAEHERRGLPVRTRLSTEHALPGLIDEAEGARLLVAGLVSETVADAVLGSVTLDVLGHATCPVAVIRRSDAIGGAGVLAGIGSPAADAGALALAFAEADAHGDPLTVVHADGHRHGLPPTELVDEVDRWAKRFPQVGVQIEGVRGSAADVLAARSAGARMLVVGSRGHHRVARVLLGSTSRVLVWNSACPVVVAPHAGLHDAGVAADDPAGRADS